MRRSMTRESKNTAGSTVIYFDHDGGVDDYLSLVLLMAHHIGAKHTPGRVHGIERSYGRFRLLGITVTPGNCISDAAVCITKKILNTFLLNFNVPVAESTLTMVNPFPEHWRLGGNILKALDELESDTDGINGLSHSSSLSGQQQLVERILSSDKPVTLLVTGPLSNLAWALTEHPEILFKISEVVIMGGAIDLPGNVNTEDDSKSEQFPNVAEWNFYCDPIAAARVWESDLSLTLVPLDAIMPAPFKPQLVDRLTILGNKCRYAAITVAIWASMEAARADHAFDLIATAYVVQPNLFKDIKNVCSSVISSGPEQGRIIRSETGGKVVKVVGGLDVDGFYDMLISDLGIDCTSNLFYEEL